jgi:hypothetical protein
MNEITRQVITKFQHCSKELLLAPKNIKKVKEKVS